MGQELQHEHFRKRDFSHFHRALSEETALLQSWFEEGKLDGGAHVVGFELEAWLLDAQHHPAPRNQEFLEKLNHPLVVSELASFNIELNGTPQFLTQTPDPFRKIADELEQTWDACTQQAQQMGMDVAMVGIPPTLQEIQMQLDNMTPVHRYYALNEHMIRLRHGQPTHFLIEGEETFQAVHQDVTMEGAATSLQIHLQVPFEQSVNAYNAALLLSAPMVALCANSPLLFGKPIWAETRIPLFEQAFSIDAFAHRLHGNGRVTFGTGFAKESLFELFAENLEHYPILIADQQLQPAEKMENVHLHNGVIWRWNRPLIGFEENGTPHVRIEHRPVGAGPSLPDTMANVVFFTGAMLALLKHEDIVEEIGIPFETAEENFYTAAKHGLDTIIHWKNGKTVPVRELLRMHLLPLAREGLKDLELAESDWGNWLEMIEGRLQTGQNGAAWQRKFAAQHGRDMDALMQAYLEGQHSGNPVHLWKS